MIFRVILKEEHPGTWVAGLAGRLDGQACEGLERKMEDPLSAQCRVLIFDMTKLDYVGSAGLATIFRIRRAVESGGGAFHMTNLKPHVRRLFDILRALPEDNVFMDREETSAYLRAMQQKDDPKRGRGRSA